MTTRKLFCGVHKIELQINDSRSKAKYFTPNTALAPLEYQ